MLAMMAGLLLLVEKSLRRTNIWDERRGAWISVIHQTLILSMILVVLPCLGWRGILEFMIVNIVISLEFHRTYDSIKNTAMMMAVLRWQKNWDRCQ